MKKLILLFCFLQFYIFTDAQTYRIDPGHSAAISKVKRFGAVDVIGRFNEVTGSVNYHPEDFTKTSAEAVIRVESYAANNLGGEKAVKGSAFLDATQFPEMSFVSTRAYEEDGQQYIAGQLTIHGVTKEVTFPVTVVGPVLDLPTKKQSIGLNSSIVINRLDFGVGVDRHLPNGIEVIGKDVTIELHVLAIAK